MADRRASVDLLGLTLLQLAALWATAAARGLPGLWVLALPALIALAQPQRHPPLVLLRLLARTVWVVAGLMLACGAAWVLYPLIPDTFVTWIGLGAGLLLLCVGSCLGFGTEVMPAARGALPAALGALLAAALEPRAALGGPLIVAGLAVVVLLVARAPGGVGPRLAFTLIVAVGLALGGMRFLPWAQPYVESRVASALNGPAGITGFGTSASLGDVGALAQSSRPVLRVYAPGALKLRGAVFTRFDGHGWTIDATPVAPALEFVDATPAAWPKVASGAWRVAARPRTYESSETDLHLTVAALLDEKQLFVPIHLLAARVASRQLEWSLLDTLSADPPAQAYDLVARGASLGAPGAAACAACLELPRRLDPRIELLARTLAAGAATPQERVARTLAHLDATCRYSLAPGAFVTRDPLAEFLFLKQRGYCEYFATAAAVLLRLQDLPTRYVKGFNITAARRTAGHYLVREADAHAWIDVQLPGAGWIEVDPTPPGEYAELHGAEETGFDGLWEAMAGRVTLLRLWWAGHALPRWSLVAALALALVLSMTPRWLRRARRGRVQVAAARARATTLRLELRALVRRFDEECAARGAPRAAARGLREHLESLEGERFGEAWRAAGDAAVECVYAEVYAGRAASTERLRALGADLQRS